MSGARLGLVGDRSDEVRAHAAIPQAIRLATAADAGEIQLTWLSTRSLESCADSDLAAYDGVWVVPGSPYESMRGALRAIRFARETGRPLLGTCGGFQHALLEYARHVLGLSDADHTESNPSAELPLVNRLACSLVGTRGEITLSSGSLVARAYGTERVTESYHCSYGLNQSYAPRFEGTALKVVGVDEAGQARSVELEGHPFFVATLFQPELSALRGERHPLIAAFARALAAARQRRAR